MGNALSSGVSGMQAHQKMLDVAGNNISNVNTTAFKSSRITFSEALSQTLRDATQPVDTVGGTNPMQVGGGATVGIIERNMTIGDIESTGRPLDMAIEGEGYFTLYDGSQSVYTRAGGFAVDANNYLVDPSTGYRVTRIGSEGLAEGFQSMNDNYIRIPYDMVIPAQETQNMTLTGNLRADSSDPTTLKLQSGLQFTVSGTAADAGTLLSSLDQVSGGSPVGGTIAISGTDRSGGAVAGNVVIGAATDLQDVLTEIENAFGGNVNASISGGEIVVEETTTGYSMADVSLTYTAAGGETMELPNYFQISQPGGEEVRKVSIDVYDQRGGAHALSAAFCKTGPGDTWDLVLTSIEGDIAAMSDRRIQDISFMPNGAYGGLTSGDDQWFDFEFANMGAATRVNVDMGSVGKFDGVTQFGAESTANASDQDGYGSGSLNALSVSREGVIIGLFSNGIRKDVAAVRVSTFQNPAGLESIGKNYFIPTSNSGAANGQKALSGKSGAIRGSSLEKSNADIAEEFVSLIQAQNGFQANARTITVANEMLRELTQLIR